MSETRNTEMVVAADIIDWLRERRDEAAAARKRAFTLIEIRTDQVKGGTLSPEDAAVLNDPVLLEANAQDTLALRFYTALDEIERGRAIMSAMRNALKARGHYIADEPESR